MADSIPLPGLPNIVPPGVTNAEINIANEPPSSPVPPDKAPVANLFGRSLGVTQNKRPSIRREESGHTPTRKKRGNTMCRASSVKARIAIQDALATDMLSLHVKDMCDASLHRHMTAVITPDGDCGDADSDCGNADGDRGNVESDDEDYSPDPIAPSNQQQKRVKK
jgi:hypothetical protein